GTWKPIGPPQKHQFLVGSGMHASRDGKTVLLCGPTGPSPPCQLWDTAAGKPIGRRWSLPHNGRCRALSPDGTTALTDSARGKARFRNAATGEPLGPELEHQGQVTAAAFSPDGRIAVTGSEDGTARLWDVARRQPLGSPLQHRGAVSAVAFSPNGRIVL